MFAKHKLGAACLQAFGSIQTGAIVPEMNELYTEVRLWLQTNEFLELPDDFGVAPPSAESVRAERDSIIDQVSREIERVTDTGGNPAEWRAYRQHLRDVPEQEGFPTDVNWGIRPDEFTGA